MKDKIKGNKMKNYILITFLLLFTIGCTQKTNTGINTNDTEKVAIVNNDFLTENALHDAVRANDLKLTQFLIKQGAQINKKDKYGFSPLHLAVRLHNYDITKYLIFQGADVNTKDVYEDTPLLDSTRNDDTNISRVLICNGAERNVSDRHQMSTLNNSSKNNNKFISMLLRTDNIQEHCEGLTFIQPRKTGISINEINNTTNSKPRVCGTIINDDIIKIDLNLKDENKENYGLYNAKIDYNNNTWCADVTDPLPNGRYDVFATGYKKSNDKFNDAKQLKVYVIPGLYDALMMEFKNDFEPWGAQLDKDTLTFRFTKPSVLFYVGEKDLKDDYKQIIADFFPRYIKIISKYQEDIKNIIIEGHSSSEYSLGDNIAEKFELNRILSENRAKEVLKYSTNLQDELISEQIVWIVTVFKAEGLSSSQLIYDINGIEDKEKSRRVDYRIQTKNLEGGN